MPRQVLELLDYFAPLAALVMFALAMLLFAFYLINFFYITERDDLTVFEKFGASYDLCLGPHAMSDIYRGGPRVFPIEEHQRSEVQQQLKAGPSSGSATMAKEVKA